MTKITEFYIQIAQLWLLLLIYYRPSHHLSLKDIQN